MKIPEREILVVGDTSQIKEALDSSISRMGFRTTFVEKGDSSLEPVKKGSYDLVLMDCMEGFDDLGTMRKRCDRPIIVITTEDQDRVLALERGADDCITWPFKDVDIHSRVRTHLALAKMGDVMKTEEGDGPDVPNMEDRERFLSRVKRRNSYLIKEKGHTRSMELYTNLTKYSGSGLLLTTKHPDVIREAYGQGDPMGTLLWLSSSEYQEEGANSSNLTEIHHKVSSFIKNKEDAVILFLGLETMITLNEFEKVFRFLTSLVDLATIHKARLLVSVDPQTMSQRELRILETVLTEIREDDL